MSDGKSTREVKLDADGWFDVAATVHKAFGFVVGECRKAIRNDGTAQLVDQLEEALEAAVGACYWISENCPDEAVFTVSRCKDEKDPAHLT